MNILRIAGGKKHAYGHIVISLWSHDSEPYSSYTEHMPIFSMDYVFHIVNEASKNPLQLPDIIL